MRWLIALPVILVLVSGTVAAVSNKALYDWKAHGHCGYHGFEKPYFLTLAMFVGEALCLLVYFTQQWWARESSKIWLAQRSCGLYKFDIDMARRRRERQEEAARHGIEPYDEAAAAAAGAMSDDEMDAEDEERSLLGGGADGQGNGSGAPSPTNPQLNGSSRRVRQLTDPDLLDLQLSEEERRRKREANKPSKFVYLGLSLFDLSASAIGGVGLLYIDASSNQMLRGSMVVFTALFSKLLLRRRLSWKQWSGIMAVVGGLALVGMCGIFRASAVLTPKAQASTHNQVSPGSALLGLMLVLLGSALNSIQNVFEEMLVKRVGSDSIDALEIVGWEGVWGTLVSGLVLLPIVHHIPGGNCGSVESIHDTLALMSNSALVVGMVVAYTLSLAFMNAYSVVLSKEVSAVFRQLINALRVVSIWIISIMLFYWFTKRSMGEGWDRYSWLQLGGFTMLLGGTLLYGTSDGQAAVEVDHPFLARGISGNSDAPLGGPNGSSGAAGIASDSLQEDDDGIDGDDRSSHPIHIGEGTGPRISKRTKSVARSPGIETFPLPDARDSVVMHGQPTPAPSLAVARRQAAALHADEVNDRDVLL